MMKQSIIFLIIISLLLSEYINCQSPTTLPTTSPTTLPTTSPTTLPTTSPTTLPTTSPTDNPTSLPSGKPSTTPSSLPSRQPTGQPTRRPSCQPSSIPSCQPSSQPTNQPTTQPSIIPTSHPTLSNLTRSFPCGLCGEIIYDNGLQICTFKDSHAITYLIPTNNICDYSSYDGFVSIGAQVIVKNDAPLIISTNNFTLSGNLSAASINIFTNTFELRGKLISYGNSPSNCIESMTNTGDLSCSKLHNGFKNNNNTNTIIIVASKYININYGSIMSSFILACSESISVNSGLLSTSGLGCKGYSSNSNSCLAGGRNYGQDGGQGQGQCNCKSSTYDKWKSYNSQIWTSGQGGCCNTNSKYSYGGGIIVVSGYNNIDLNGNISSNGESIIGDSCGAGAGGAVIVNTTSLTGDGYITAKGGNGPATGGSGGGGYILITNPTNTSYDYNLNYNSYTFVSAANGTNGKTSTQDGSTGQLHLPICQIGQGNNMNNTNFYTFCETCSPGFYSPSVSALPCQSCSSFFDDLDLDSNKFYPVAFSSSAECAYIGSSPYQCCYNCKTGFIGKRCINQFIYFLQSTTGKIAIALVVLSIVASVAYALKYHLYDKKRKWLKTKEEDFITKVLYGSANFAVNHEDNKDLLKEKLILNPLFAEKGNEMEGLEKGRYSPRRLITKGSNVSYKDIQLAWRLHDNDLPYHSCRIYLIGSNELLDRRGGPWRLPQNRPVCIRPMIRKVEYEALAKKINKTVIWNFFSIESLLLIFLFIINPFLALYLQYIFKKRRAHRLIQLIVEYNHECFRSFQQRESKNSIRIGISPDCSLAYLDFLCDKTELSKVSRIPLCPIGQPALPLAVVFSGIGTFFSPFCIDSNDVLVQAVCDNDQCSAFIDGSWINFIADLNKHLRTVHRENLFSGLKKLLNFLKDPKTTEQLGGLVVNLCSFPNDVNSIPDEIDYDHGRPLKVIDEKFEELATQLTETNQFTEFSHRSSIAAGNVIGRLKDIMDIKNSQVLEEFDSIDTFSTWTVDKGKSVEATRIFEEYETEKVKQKRIEVEEKEIEVVKTKVGCRESIEESLKKFFNEAFVILGDFYGSNHEVGTNYHDLIWSVVAGKSKLGIIITHSKVVSSKIQFNTCDFINDKLMDYDNDPKIVRISSSRQSHIETMGYRDSIEPRDTELSNFKPSFIEKSSDDATTSSRLYGDKAEEMNKYYNIVYKAEGNLNELDRRKSEESVKSTSFFRKKVQTQKPKDNVTYEQFMRRSFFTSETLEDEELVDSYALSVGKDVPPNLVHLKGNISRDLLNDIISLQYNNILYIAPSGYQCPFAYMWEGNTLKELTCSPLNCFLSAPSRSISPVNVTDSPEVAKSRATSDEMADKLSEFNSHTISIVHQIENENTTVEAVENRLASSFNGKKNILLQSNNNRQSTIPPPVVEEMIPGKRIFSMPSVLRRYIIVPFFRFSKRLYYFLRFFIGYSFFGVNILPYGDARYVFPALRVLVFLTSLIEAADFFFLSFYYLSIWTKSSSKVTPTALYLVVAIPPLAIVLNPILGLFTGMIGPVPSVARAFTSFNRSAAISTFVVLIIYVLKFQNISNNSITISVQNLPPCGVLVMILLLNKTLQLFVVDLYASHVENFRLSRGWNGLSTSLSPTEDMR